MDGRRRVTQQIDHSLKSDYRSEIADVKPSYWQAVWRGNRGQGLGRLLTLSLFAATIGYGLVLGGHVKDRDYALMNAPDWFGTAVGLKVRQINVQGSQHLDAATILRALGLKRHESMLGFDVAAARKRLEKLDWVANAEIMKLFPGQVVVKITERVPYALWQVKGEHLVIDRAGVVLKELKAHNHVHLPLVVGEGANSTAAPIIKFLASFPTINGRVRALVRVADRRWNIKLLNGFTVMLPEKKPTVSLKEFAELEKKYGLSKRNLRLVDFRLPDRITLRPLEKAAPKVGTRKGPSGAAKKITG